ncbi:MAG: RluA family pseudouridine synthase [Candidatus Hydrogenedentes bacterium]|nr:RluA family pseudouridine synthase [Candidatus Hydrogenedentota bacterium]
MHTSHTYEVETATTLFSFLTERLPDQKRTNIKKLLKFKSVFVNQKPVTKFDHPLLPGDLVHIKGHNPEKSGKRPPFTLQILHEDKDIIVVVKPPKLLTIATEKEKTNTAYHQLWNYVEWQNPHRGERIFIVHRIDRDTSGLLVFARTEAIKRVLQERWDEVEKRYYAVVEGVPKKSEDVIESHLRESDKSLKVHSVAPADDAKYAATKYKVVKVGDDYSLLDITLLTGRKNQIRVHLADRGHPVVGDKKYGATSNPAKRLGLHAYHLSFIHPTTGKRMVFSSELPPELKKLLKLSNENKAEALRQRPPAQRDDRARPKPKRSQPARPKRPRAKSSEKGRPGT